MKAPEAVSADRSEAVAFSLCVCICVSILQLCPVSYHLYSSLCVWKTPLLIVNFAGQLYLFFLMN